jgi:hypothetical protein
MPHALLPPLAEAFLRFTANAAIRMARDDVAQHAQRAFLRQLVDRVERLLADAGIGIVEDGAFKGLLRAIERLTIIDLGEGLANRIERLSPNPGAFA